MQANAGHLLNEGQADGDMFASAAAKSDLSEDEMALMKMMLKEEVDATIDFSNEDFCKEIPSVCQKLSWNALKILAPKALEKLTKTNTPEQPFSHNYIGMERLERSLLSFIPSLSSITSEDGIPLTPFKSSAVGNCFWCNLSMHLAGDEKWQNFIRLCSALYAMMNAYQFVEKDYYRCF